MERTYDRTLAAHGKNVHLGFDSSVPMSLRFNKNERVVRKHKHFSVPMADADPFNVIYLQSVAFQRALQIYGMSSDPLAEFKNRPMSAER